MKTLVYLATIIFLLTAKSSFSQKDCWSMESYPFLDTKLLNDSINAEKEITSYDNEVKLYFESMTNCKMPKLNALSLDGDTITNESLLGKVVVINFWFIGCPPCIAEIPYLDSIQQHFKNKNVAFIGISRDDTRDIFSFIKERNFTYKMIANGSELSWNFAVNGWPKTYIFDKKNRFKSIFYNIRGEGEQLEIENKIKELL